MKTKYIKIGSIKELSEALNTDNFTDFVIALAGGAVVSRKEIRLSATPTGRERYQVFNGIDGTMQFLSAKQIMSVNHSNIGEAIKKGAFYQVK